MAIKLGSKVKDEITGYTGIAVGRLEFLYGCTRIQIEAPLDKDGKPQDPHWFDEQRVTLLEELPVPDSTKGAVKTGGPSDAPRRQEPPQRPAPRR